MRVTFVAVRSKASKATSDIMSYILQKHTILRADNGVRKMSPFQKASKPRR